MKITLKLMKGMRSANLDFRDLFCLMKDRACRDSIGSIKSPQSNTEISFKGSFNPSEIYQLVTSQGYSIKGKPTIIREDGISTDNQRLANDYLETKARLNPINTRKKMVSKYNSKLTNAEVEK